MSAVPCIREAGNSVLKFVRKVGSSKMMCKTAAIFNGKCGHPQWVPTVLLAIRGHFLLLLLGP